MIATRTQEITFQVDVSRTYRNKKGYKVGGYHLNNSFVTETHTPQSFLETVIKEGWPYTMAHAKRSPEETGAVAREVSTPKHLENFISRQELTGDDDSQAPGVVDFWLNDPFFSAYGWAFVESVNSKPEAQKGHPTFIFDRPIDEPALYKECMKALNFAYKRLDPLNNIDRTIYNAQNARVHPLGNICPFDVFEREILAPYRAHVAEQKRRREAERAKRLADYETAKKAGLVSNNAGDIERFIIRSVDGIVDYLAKTQTGRHNVLLWAGRKIGALRAALWAAPFLHLLDCEQAIIQATITNGYYDAYAHSDNEVLRTFNDGLKLGALSPADPPLLYRQTLAGGVQAVDPIAPQTFTLKPYELSEAARARRDAVLAESEAAKEAKAQAAKERAAEIERRYQAGDAVNFVGDDPIDPDYIEHMRARFTNAQKWANWIKEAYPDLDADEQCQIKLAENREARPGKCGEYRKVVLPNGKVITRRWGCGLCDKCLKRGVAIYNRALCEIQGLAVDNQFYSMDAIDAGIFDDAPRENAPPLPIVQGDLSLVTIHGDTKERVNFGRTLRREGVAYRCQPITLAGEVAYDFLVNDDRGEPLAMLTDERLLLWVKGAENKRASGGLLPGLKRLEERYREALPYEVRLPELDDEGEPVDPDIFYLELPDIGTSDRLPDIAVDFKVYDRDTLQAALYEINQEQFKILNRRKRVNYGVYIKKKFYTRYSTLDRLLAEFNKNQAKIRQKKGLPALE